MKTAESHLEEQGIDVPKLTLFQYEGILKAMQSYASQAIDECAESATTKYSEFLGTSKVDKQSILNVKNNLK